MERVRVRLALTLRKCGNIGPNFGKKDLRNVGTWARSRPECSTHCDWGKHMQIGGPEANEGNTETRNTLKIQTCFLFLQRALWSCASLKWFECVLESTSVYSAALSRLNVNPVGAFGCVEVVWMCVTSPYLAHPERAVTYEHLQTPKAYLARSHPANHNIRRKHNDGLLSAQRVIALSWGKTLAGRAQMDFRIINNSGPRPAHWTSPRTWRGSVSRPRQHPWWYDPELNSLFVWWVFVVFLFFSWTCVCEKNLQPLHWSFVSPPPKYLHCCLSGNVYTHWYICTMYMSVYICTRAVSFKCISVIGCVWIWSLFRQFDVRFSALLPECKACFLCLVVLSAPAAHPCLRFVCVLLICFLLTSQFLHTEQLTDSRNSYLSVFPLRRLRPDFQQPNWEYIQDKKKRLEKTRPCIYLQRTRLWLQKK